MVTYSVEIAIHSDVDVDVEKIIKDNLIEYFKWRDSDEAREYAEYERPMSFVAERLQQDIEDNLIFRDSSDCFFPSVDIDFHWDESDYEDLVAAIPDVQEASKDMTDEERAELELQLRRMPGPGQGVLDLGDV